MIRLEPFTWSYRCYGALLYLYPAEFRIRFGREMRQIFLDCCRDAVEFGTPAEFLRFWLDTLRDLSISIPRERLRDWLTSENLAGRTAGFVDSLVIWGIIGYHLFVGGAGIAAYIIRNYTNAAEFLLLTLVAGSVLGAAGVICS